MPRLSRPIETIRPHYDVVVIGSGYGGGVSAARLSRAGRRVCVLERGREFLPGDFPEDEVGFAGEVQLTTPRSHRVGAPSGLFDFRLGPDIHVLVGCGLGGTSLINASVCLRPEARVLADTCWPQALRDDIDGRLEDGFRAAEAMLSPETYPEGHVQPGKLQALLRAGAEMGEKTVRLPLAVRFGAAETHHGVAHQPCRACGDCVTGCNHEAKKTVAATYLPDAVQHGAELFCEVQVRRLVRRGFRWLVYFEVPGYGRESFPEVDAMCITADLVVLAAGALGTPEILMRSREAGLALSDKLGTRFSGNGDVIGFGYNNRESIGAVGWGKRPGEERPPVGPTLTGMIDLREQERLHDGIVVQDGAIPGAIARPTLIGMMLAAGAFGEGRAGEVADTVKGLGRELDGAFAGPYAGALHNTSVYIVTGHDDASGELSFAGDRVQLTWPQVGLSREVSQVQDALRRVIEPLGGLFVPNPLWVQGTHALITVHPLGGCPMGQDASEGAVNHKGQVFSGTSGEAVYDNLYVCDGSIVPCSLGANPLMTICALSERACQLIAEDRGWTVSTAAGPQRPLPIRESATGVAFTEAMRGHFSLGETVDFAAGARQGAIDGSSFDCVLSVFIRDLEACLADPRHPCPMIGTVDAPMLSSGSLTVHAGVFGMFVENLAEAGTRNLIYRMQLHGRAGEQFYVDGYKVVRDDAGIDLWTDMTTLFTTIHKGTGPEGQVIGKGILRVQLGDFMKQLASMRALGTGLTTEQKLGALLRFGKFFGWALVDTYGKFFGGSSGPVGGTPD